MRLKMMAAVLALVSAWVCLRSAQCAENGAIGNKPNIVFILCDDLGLGDIGVFFQNARRDANNRSQPWHLTPNIDALANDGIQLRDHYCPASVCAPSRASLMLGVHQGHANVRDNQFDKALENNHTIASVLKQAGYATCCIGKWGLQGKADPAVPNGFPAHPMNRGFDAYFGYIAHVAGHWHYPKEDKQVLYEGAKDVSEAYDKCYTTDLFTARSKKWIGEQHAAHPDQPFYLYLAYDTPHAKLQLPPCPYPAGNGKDGGVQWLGTPGKMINTAEGAVDGFIHPDYASVTWDHDRDPSTPEKPWPDVYKRYATDVRRIDDCVGDLIHYLKDLGIDHNTLVIFTSDNGPSIESYLAEPYAANFFGSYGPHDGIKRDLWEGGIDVGAIACWPGVIPAKQVSRTPSGAWDWMATFADAAGIPAPARTDGVSLLPTLTGVGTQKASRVYIEYFVGGKTPGYAEFAPAHRNRVRRQMQVLRIGDYEGLRYDLKSPGDLFEIYDIVKDPQQTTNLADRPEFAKLQQEFHDTALQSRRPDAEAKRPYDDELVPAIDVEHSIPGVEQTIFNESVPWVSKTDRLTVAKKAVVSTLSMQWEAAQAGHECLFEGMINAPTDGLYTFEAAGGDEALLRIHEATVLDTHGGKTQASIRLQKGKHLFQLYQRRTDAARVQTALNWSGPGFETKSVEDAVLSHRSEK